MVPDHILRQMWRDEDSAGGVLFLAPFPGFLTAEFPDDAALTEFTVEAGVGAGLADVQTLLAVADFVLLTHDGGGPFRVKTAMVHEIHN